MGLWEAQVAAPPFSGAAVLVTGAGTGIGAHASLELAKAGWVVIASVYDNAQKEALQKRAGLYKAVHIVLLDVTSLRSIEDVKTYVISEAIPLVAVVNNAAVGSPLPSCQKAGYYPKIVNISSGAAIFGQPLHGPYTIAKTALEGFSDVLRRELRPQGIQVVVVQPSAIKTKAYGQWESALNALWKKEADKLYGETKRRIVAVTRLALKGGFEPQVAGRRIASAVSLPSSWSRVKIGYGNGTPSSVII